MEEFDLLVLGGGPAGYLGAERAAQGGLKTAVFEERALGGVCLNEGCIPSKTLLYCAKTYSHALHGEAFGIRAENLSIDHGAVIRRKVKVVKMLVSGVAAKMKALGVEVVAARAAITGKTADGFTVVAGGVTYAGKYLLVATGSAPVIPPIPGLGEGLERGFVMTNREILDLAKQPEHLAVIGGGVIGLEMASYFNAIGTKVTVIELLDKIAGQTEDEASAMLQTIYTKRGVDFRLGCRVTEVGDHAVAYEKDGQAGHAECDAVLLSAGRRAVTQGVGLETIGVYTDRGAIVTDDKMRTNIPHVWAAGDVNGRSMLAHTAYREAEVAVNDMLGKADAMRYDAIPSVIYTDPEAAGVGETVETARAKGLSVYAKKLSMRHSGRFLAETDRQDGLCKLVFEEGTDRLIGAHLVGSYASEIILSAGTMINTRWPLDSLKKIVFAHPTVGEIIREGLFEGQSPHL